MILAGLAAAWIALLAAIYVALRLLPGLSNRRGARLLGAAAVLALLFASDHVVWRYAVVPAALEGFLGYAEAHRHEAEADKPTTFAIAFVPPEALERRCPWYCFSEIMFDRVQSLYTSEGATFHRLLPACPPGGECRRLDAFEAFVEIRPAAGVDAAAMTGGREPECVGGTVALLYRTLFCSGASLSGGEAREVTYSAYIESSLIGRIWENPSWEAAARGWVSFDFAKDQCAIHRELAAYDAKLRETCLNV